MVSDLGAYERETRAAVNALEAAVGALGVVTTFTNYNVSGGQTTIAIGVGLNDVPIESVLITGTGLAALQTITGARSGQIKIFIMGDANISLVDSGSRANGTFDLNQLPVGTSFGNYLRDVIALLNIDGDPDANNNGYWKEIFRTPSAE
jgi:hypothetical protein